MNITALARHRAECAARLEAITQLPIEGDDDEQHAHRIALDNAREAYREAEQGFAQAVATMTTRELRALGVPLA